MPPAGGGREDCWSAGTSARATGRRSPTPSTPARISSAGRGGPTSSAGTGSTREGKPTVVRCGFDLRRGGRWLLEGEERWLLSTVGFDLRRGGRWLLEGEERWLLSTVEGEQGGGDRRVGVALDVDGRREEVPGMAVAVRRWAEGGVTTTWTT
ncbi:uncharacterized protein A4U43_C05F4930 [Asparagus officinalis]|uniref:Uncharacterized protein n=1 Tax=Asparagus officinalis TaxID=4686 RepID=A0A5P1ERY1_ASPOF|nr:uncharacterized protein A4U43_C05F4930 [Asparagus officinalis]